MNLQAFSRVWRDIFGKFSIVCSIIISLNKVSRDVTFEKYHRQTRGERLPPHRLRSRNSHKSFLMWFYSLNLVAMWLSRNVTGKYAIKAFHCIVYVAERAGLCVTWLIHSCVWHHSFIYMCSIIYSCICVTWLIVSCVTWCARKGGCVCDVTRFFMCAA